MGSERERREQDARDDARRNEEELLRLANELREGDR